MSSTMAQRQLAKMEGLTKTPCLVCSQLKAAWDTHDNCFNCRICSRKKLCDICAKWDKTKWSRIERQQKEYTRRSFPLLEGTET